MSSYHLLPSVTIRYRQCPSIAVNYHQLSIVTVNYQRLSSITVTYLRLPPNAVGELLGRKDIYPKLFCEFQRVLVNM